MPDISMCKNNACPSRNDCYRFSAKPNEYRQAYAEFDFGGGNCCDDFIPTAKYAEKHPSKSEAFRLKVQRGEK